MCVVEDGHTLHHQCWHGNITKEIINFLYTKHSTCVGLNVNLFFSFICNLKGTKNVRIYERSCLYVYPHSTGNFVIKPWNVCNTDLKHIQLCKF
jgi:hypothetical protein